MLNWIRENWDLIVESVVALYVVAEIIVRLTPSEKDNAILNKIANFVSQFVDLIVPNLKKKGGVHNQNLGNDTFKVLKKKFKKAEKVAENVVAEVK